MHWAGDQHQAPVLPELPALWIWFHGRRELQSVAHWDQWSSSLCTVSTSRCMLKNSIFRISFWLLFTIGWKLSLNGFQKIGPELSEIILCLCWNVCLFFFQKVSIILKAEHLNLASLIIPSSPRKLYPELCQGIVDVAISSVFTLNNGGDSSSASSSPYSSSPSSTFITNSTNCSSPKLRGPLHVGPFTRL